MWPLLPMTIGGVPGMLTPQTYFAASEADAGHKKAMRYQVFGTRSSKWGSFAKIGIPLCVLEAATTQQLLQFAIRGSKRSRPPGSALGIAQSCLLPSGN